MSLEGIQSNQINKGDGEESGGVRVPQRQSNLTARSDVGRVGVRRGGGFSEWGQLCCVQRSRREGGLAGPSRLTEKREGERVGVLVAGFVRGNHT